MHSDKNTGEQLHS